jgi:hypothetical protein
VLDLRSGIFKIEEPVLIQTMPGDRETQAVSSEELEQLRALGYVQ